MNTSDFEGIWVVADYDAGIIDHTTFEALAAAHSLVESGSKDDTQISCLILGSGAEGAAEQAFRYGADRAITVDDVRLDDFNEETIASLMTHLVEKHRPETILGAASLRNRSLLPRVAVLTGSGASADCIALERDESSGNITLTRPVYGGNKIATVMCERRPQVITLRPRSFEALEPEDGRSGEILLEKLKDEDLSTTKKILETIRDEGSVIKLADAEIIVAGGRGMKGPEGFELLQELAKLLGGAVGASRAAVDAGWIAYPHQVGQTGQTVTTRVYVACGISGQIQHLVGMQSSDFIIAINKDPEAPVMQIADVAVVGDLFEIVPELIKQLGE